MRTATRGVSKRLASILALGVSACALSLCGFALCRPALAAGPPEAPVTEAATGVTSSSAVLNGTLNPGMVALAGWYFSYSEAGSCTGAATTPLEPEAEVMAQHEQFEVTGLQPDLEYTFCLVATHTVEETTESTTGAPLVLKTLASPPAVDSESATGITFTDATLEAQINPNNEATSYLFQYATNGEMTGATTIGAGNLPVAFGDQPVSVDLGGTLQQGVTYYYRVIAENATGRSEGAVQSFATNSPPVLGSVQAQNTTRGTVVLSGVVNPKGAATSYHFEVTTQAGYLAALGEHAPDPYAGGYSTPGVGTGEGQEAQATGPVLIEDLTPGTTYHYALFATNQHGTTTSADGSFTTSPLTPPLLETEGASSITQTTALITGTVNPQGSETVYGFEIGISPGVYEPATGLGILNANTGSTTVALNANGLKPGTTYHYRLTARSAAGTSHGEDRTLTTEGLPASALPVALLNIPAIAFPTDTIDTSASKTKSKTPPQTRKLTNALKQCKHKPKSKRHACEKQARAKHRSGGA